ncbi:MAG: acyl carrier protein [Rhodoferax sp.]|nr:acyl carrier protein [Rhodoferax sp.]
MKPTPPALLTLEQVRSRVIATVAEQLGITQAVLLNDSVFADLGADSLDEVELMMAFEDEFRIDINDEAFASVHTIGDAAQYIFDQIVALQ